jgi:glycogen synthase
MRILFLSTDYPPYSPEKGGGGIGTYVECIAPALAARGHDVHVLSCAWPWPPPSDHLENGVWIHRRSITKIKGLWRIIRTSFQTRNRIILALSNFVAVKRLGLPFDVIEYPEWGAEGLLFALARRTPSVAHLHTGLAIASRYAGNKSSRRDLRAGCAMERISVRRADVVTTGSEMLARDMCEAGWLNQSQIRIMACPIEWKRWATESSALDTAPVVLFCGRIEERKAPEILVDALALLKPEIPGLEGRFIGYYNVGRDGEPLMDWTTRRNLDHCRFEGQLSREKVVEAIQSCRLFVQASYYESFGLAAAEAMAAGRPVVVTSTTGIAEFVRTTAAGEVVPPGHARVLADAMRPYLTDPSRAAETGKRAGNVVMREMDASKIASLREQVYRDAIESFYQRRARNRRPLRHRLSRKYA